MVQHLFLSDISLSITSLSPSNCHECQDFILFYGWIVYVYHIYFVHSLKQPRVLPYHMPRFFAACPVQRWSLLPHLSNLSCPCYLLWLAEGTKSDIMGLTLLLLSFWNVSNITWKAQIKDCMERDARSFGCSSHPSWGPRRGSEALLEHLPSTSQDSRWLGPWGIPNERYSPVQPTHRAGRRRRYCCFKPLNMQMFCYTQVDNWYTRLMLAGYISLDSLNSGVCTSRIFHLHNSLSVTPPRNYSSEGLDPFELQFPNLWNKDIGLNAFNILLWLPSTMSVYFDTWLLWKNWNSWFRLFFPCPLPELFWPVYCLSIQIDEIYTISSKSIWGQDFSFSAFPAKISFLCGLCPSRPALTCFTVGGWKAASPGRRVVYAKRLCTPLSF